MTRKDYVRFAAMLKDMHIKCNQDNANGIETNPNIIVSCIEYRIADIFQSENSKFMRSKFLEACRPTWIDGVES